MTLAKHDTAGLPLGPGAGWLTRTAACLRLECSSEELARYVRMGRLTRHQINPVGIKRVRYRTSDVEAIAAEEVARIAAGLPRRLWRAS